MKIFVVLFSLISTFCLANTASAVSSIKKDVSDLAVLNSLIAYNKDNTRKVLVVFDIDDTLLEAVDFVGSDKWYRWQRGNEMRSNEGETIKISDDEKYDCLFSTLGTWFHFGDAHLTQKNIPALLDQLAAHDKLLLTSRAPDYRGATERELKENGLQTSNYHWLSKSHALSFDFNDGRRTAKVTYDKGIAMSSGLNKGKVLHHLLELAGKSYEAIYFIDDGMKNINNMHEAWKDSETRVYSLHYTKVDKSISKEEIAQSQAVKTQLQNLLSSAFRSPLAECAR